MSTQETLSALRAINEEKHQVQQYLEAIAKHMGLKHISITVQTEKESQTFIVPDAIVQLILTDLEGHFQRRNLQLIESAEVLIAKQ